MTGFQRKLTSGVGPQADLPARLVLGDDGHDVRRHAAHLLDLDAAHRLGQVRQRPLRRRAQHMGQTTSEQAPAVLCCEVSRSNTWQVRYDHRFGPRVAYRRGCPAHAMKRNSYACGSLQYGAGVTRGEQSPKHLRVGERQAVQRVEDALIEVGLVEDARRRELLHLPLEAGVQDPRSCTDRAKSRSATVGRQLHCAPVHTAQVAPSALAI